MLSVIVYGRNDSHGYNLHKRAALSLNCISEMLTSQDDEIIFVDWNSNPGIPAFIDSIHDMLTDKAKDLIKVIKVDYLTHDKYFKNKTKKVTIEPVARNVAIYRSNPKNKWILSTNTDMIFIPRDPLQTLTSICSDLKDGFYELPRFSLPEIIWESFNRFKPIEVFDSLRSWREQIDLDEKISAGPILKYDAPGDFQLCLRRQLFEINGFNEEMIYGWHVDSNLCKRMYLLNGETNTLEEKLFGYHCEHSKIETHFTSNGQQNSLIKYFDHVNSEKWIQEGTNGWGLSDLQLPSYQVIERQNEKLNFIKRYSKAPKILRNSIEANLMGALYSYSFAHASPYLIDFIIELPKTIKVYYFGVDDNNYFKIKNILNSIHGIGVKRVDEKLINDIVISGYSVFILDLGFDFAGDWFDFFNIKNENQSKLEIFKIIKCFILFLIKNYKNDDLYYSNIVTINAETYDNGFGSKLRPYLKLPQVASNSRVRIGTIRKQLKNREKDTLLKLANNTFKKFEINMSIESNVKLEEKILKNQEFELSGHKIKDFLTESDGVQVTDRGIMLSGKFNFKIELNLLKKPSKVTKFLFAFDRPVIYNNYGNINLTLKINEKEYNILLKSENNETFFISTSVLNKSSPIHVEGFYEVDLENNHLPRLRLNNLYFFNENKFDKKFLFLDLSKTDSTYLLGKGWSYSNENRIRWTTNENFEIKIPDIMKNKIKYLILDVRYFKYQNLINFVKSITDPVSGENIEFFEIPRIQKKRGRYIIVKIVNLKSSLLKFNTNSKLFLPYEVSDKDPRYLSASFANIIYFSTKLGFVIAGFYFFYHFVREKAGKIKLT